MKVLHTDNGAARTVEKETVSGTALAVIIIALVLLLFAAVGALLYWDWTHNKYVIANPKP
jgi:hypothetical protein